MANCVTCGRELHPERAEKYDYCTDPECRERNAKVLTILALGVNKAADQFRVLDEPLRDQVDSGAFVEEAASGAELARQRPSPRKRDRNRDQRGSGASGRAARPDRQRPAAGPRARRWTDAQQELALIYNQQGMRPDEIGARLGLSSYVVTQMILAGRNRAKP
jgi:hypothetical protein